MCCTAGLIIQEWVGSLTTNNGTILDSRRIGISHPSIDGKCDALTKASHKCVISVYCPAIRPMNERHCTSLKSRNTYARAPLNQLCTRLTCINYNLPSAPRRTFAVHACVWWKYRAILTSNSARHFVMTGLFSITPLAWQVSGYQM